ncbi:metal-dependent phosphohydrolase [Massilia sp. METH4]|uniref:metal-dependent phosphohydrolase n=1 Tax=Massilia sp. METH4 TaxID=3123041 RepID=UPI0030D148D0
MASSALHDLPPPEGDARPAAPPSVLRALNLVQRRLEEGAHLAPHEEPDAPEDLRATARELLHAVDLSADVALACVLRNQVGGSYAVRHSIETAVVAALVARRLHMRPVHLLSVVTAALALHATGRHEEPAGQALHGSHPRDPDLFASLLLDHSSPHASAPSSAADMAAAHLLRMADRYCAGVSPRNYRRALLPNDALARVLEQAPDAELAAAFREELGPFPPGSAVRLAGGELAVVAHRDAGGVEVLCLRDAAGRACSVPLPRRVGEGGCAIVAALGEEDGELRVSMKQVWGPLASL